MPDDKLPDNLAQVGQDRTPPPSDRVFAGAGSLQGAPQGLREPAVGDERPRVGRALFAGQRGNGRGST